MDDPIDQKVQKINTTLAKTSIAIKSFGKNDANNNLVDKALLKTAIDEAMQSLENFKQSISDTSELPQNLSPPTPGRKTIDTDCDRCSNHISSFSKIVGKETYNEMIADSYQVDDNSSLEIFKIFKILKKVNFILIFNTYFS
jgi:hypothetical protein